jgi:putative oxidoreductase
MATRFMHPTTDSERTLIVLTESHVNAVLLTLGRLIFGGYWVYSGLEHFITHATMAPYAAMHGVPAPDLAVLGTGALLLAGGVSIMTGFVPRVGATLIAIFLIGVTPIMHAFWRDADAVQRANDLVNFTKNIGLLGGVCFVAALPEPWSDRR